MTSVRPRSVGVEHLLVLVELRLDGSQLSRRRRRRVGGWWERAARWIARQNARDGRVPVRVVLRRRWSDLPPPGMNPKLRVWNEFEFYSIELR